MNLTPATSSLAPSRRPPPTIETYPELQRAHSFFNQHLFDGKLTSVLFVLDSNGRSAGHFTKHKFVSSDGKHKTHQLALNPAMFYTRSVKRNLSTLVHEMCHQYQAEYGKESRVCYHNKQWADYMEERGLIPSHTGLPGGRRTGQTMTHYIQEGGRFDALADEFIEAGFDFRWHDPYTLARYQRQQRDAKSRAIIAVATYGVTGAQASAARTATSLSPSAPIYLPARVLEPYNSSNRVKYICPTCSQATWGKRGLKILCGEDGCGARPFELEADY